MRTFTLAIDKMHGEIIFIALNVATGFARQPNETHRNYRRNEAKKKVHVDFYNHLLHDACSLSTVSVSIQTTFPI